VCLCAAVLLLSGTFGGGRDVGRRGLWASEVEFVENLFADKFCEESVSA
jgi:hypothetical protein